MKTEIESMTVSSQVNTIRPAKAPAFTLNRRPAAYNYLPAATAAQIFTSYFVPRTSNLKPHTSYFVPRTSYL